MFQYQPPSLYLRSHSYFYYPNYDIAAAEYSEKKKQAFSIAEFLTFSAAGYDASAYTGSALVSPLISPSPPLAWHRKRR